MFRVQTFFHSSPSLGAGHTALRLRSIDEPHERYDSGKARAGRPVLDFLTDDRNLMTNFHEVYDFALLFCFFNRYERAGRDRMASLSPREARADDDDIAWMDGRARAYRICAWIRCGHGHHDAQKHADTTILVPHLDVEGFLAWMAQGIGEGPRGYRDAASVGTGSDRRPQELRKSTVVFPSA